MSALWRNRNNRVVVSSEKIELDVGRDDEIMAVVDHFIGLFKRLLTCYEISRRRGKSICGTLVVLSCGFCDPGECFVTKPNCFEKIDFFCQIWKELNNTFESTQTDKKKWKVSIKIGRTFEKPFKNDPVSAASAVDVSVRFNVESKRNLQEESQTFLCMCLSTCPLNNY